MDLNAWVNVNYGRKDGRTEQQMTTQVAITFVAKKHYVAKEIKVANMLSMSLSGYSMHLSG